MNTDMLKHTEDVVKIILLYVGGAQGVFSLIYTFLKIRKLRDIRGEIIENPCKTSRYMDIFDNLIYLQFLKKKYCVTLEPDQITKFEEINKLLGKRYSLGIRKSIYPYLNPFDDFKSIHQSKIPTKLQWFCGLILVLSFICIELIWVWVYIQISILLNGWHLAIGLMLVFILFSSYIFLFINLLKDLHNYVFAFNALKYINRKDDSIPVKEASFIKLIFIAPFSNNWKKM